MSGRKDSRDLLIATQNIDGGFNKSFYDNTNKQQPFKEYLYWHKINTRCKPHYWKSRPTYEGMAVSEYFQDYNTFVLWCREQKGFFENWAIDKDLLGVTLGIRGYSEHSCVFIPLEINSFLTMRNKRVKYYTGVSYQESCNKYIVSCSQLNAKNKTLARVLCPKQGYDIYRKEKVRLAKILANTYIERIDTRVYDILNSFELYIDMFTVNPTNKGE